MNVPAEVSSAVRERAGGRCQYCQMHQALQGATFHMEHIVPRVHGGDSVLTNLALACPSCNLHKANRIAAVDPLTRQTVSLFHPLKQRWTEHFRFTGLEIVGLTAIGRATVSALNFNHARRQQIRAAERSFGLYPP
jgi:hypothetical protein